MVQHFALWEVHALFRQRSRGGDWMVAEEVLGNGAKQERWFVWTVIWVQEKKEQKERRRKSISPMLYLQKQITHSARHWVWPSYLRTTVVHCDAASTNDSMGELLLNYCIFDCMCSQVLFRMKLKATSGTSLFGGSNRWWTAEYHPAALTDLWHVLLTATQPSCLLHNTIQTLWCCHLGYYEIKGLLFHLH